MSLLKNLSVIVLVVCTLILTGCDDPGNVGGSFIDGENHLDTRTISAGSIEGESTGSFTGRHRFMPIGSYDDALFGEFTAIGIVKPSIDTTRIGSTVPEEEAFQLRLVFSTAMYGDTTSTSDFDVYRLTEPWRGNQIRFGDDIPFNDSEKIGEFSVTGRETVTVDLDGGWVQDYNQYLANEEDDRHTVYRDEFPGLAIVPAGNNPKVLFARMYAVGEEEEDDLDYVRFVVNRENGDNEDAEEDQRVFQRLADFGSLNSRAEPESSEFTNEMDLTLHHSLDRIVRIDPEINEENLGSRNLANVSMVFFKNQEILENSLPAGHVRPEVNQLRIHILESGNIGEFIFSRNPHFTADYNSEDQSFRFDLTDYANTAIFNTPRAGSFYLSAQGINGIVFSTKLFSQDAPEEMRPKILITSVNSENK